MAQTTLEQTIQAYVKMFPETANQLPVDTARQLWTELLQHPDLPEPKIDIGQVPQPFINFDWYNHWCALSFMRDGSAVWLHQNHLVKKPWNAEFANKVTQVLLATLPERD